MMFSNLARVTMEISNKESSRNKEVQEAEGDTTMDGQTVEGKHRYHLRMSIVCSLAEMAEADGNEMCTSACHGCP
jgi:hypothetical protein